MAAGTAALVDILAATLVGTQVAVILVADTLPAAVPLLDTLAAISAPASVPINPTL